MNAGRLLVVALALLGLAACGSGDHLQAQAPTSSTSIADPANGQTWPTGDVPTTVDPAVPVVVAEGVQLPTDPGERETFATGLAASLPDVDVRPDEALAAGALACLDTARGFPEAQLLQDVQRMLHPADGAALTDDQARTFAEVARESFCGSDQG